MRVLVATDGSDMAGIACEQAIDLAAHTAGQLRIVAVVPPVDELFGGVPHPAIALATSESMHEAATRQLRTCLEAELARVPEGVPATAALLRGHVATVLLAEASRWGADLLVVGSRGHGTLAALVLGSVSQELVDHADIPVLVARRPKVRRLLVAVDPAGSTDGAVAFIAQHCLLGATSVKVVGVVAPHYPWWVGVAAMEGVAMDEIEGARVAMDRMTRDAVDAAVRRLSGPGIDVTGELVEGHPADELELAIAAWDADIAIVGTRRRHAASAMVLGSVARKVLQHAPSSVLVVHPTLPADLRSPRPAVEPVAPEARSIR